MGIIVDERYRRRGVARELTRERLALLKQRASKAYYFCNAQNQSSIDLHRKFGFKEVTRDFSFPGVSFIGGVGVLYEVPFQMKADYPYFNKNDIPGIQHLNVRIDLSVSVEVEKSLYL